MTSRARIPLLICAFAMIGGVFLFQNCAGNMQFAGQSLGVSPQGGAGADGMIARAAYQSIKACADGSVDVGAYIEVKEFKDRKEVYLTRKDCKALSPPLPLQLSDFTFALRDPNVFVYDNQIFDLVLASGNQRITTNVCTGTSALVDGSPSSLNTLTWIMESVPQKMLGNVTLDSGATTGPLTLIQPEVSVLASLPTGGDNSMKLTFSAGGMTSQLKYQIGTGWPVSYSSNLQCLRQPVPAELQVYSWVKSGLGPCSLGKQTEHYECVDNTGSVVEKALCSSPSPSSQFSCLLKTVEFTFNPSTAGAQWTVPPGVNLIKAIVIAGGGGASPSYGGGAGGEAIATIQVTQGAMVSVAVGGPGVFSLSGPMPGGASHIYISGGIMLQAMGGSSATDMGPGPGGAASIPPSPQIQFPLTITGNAGSMLDGGAPPDQNYPLYGGGGSGGTPGIPAKPGYVLIQY